MINQIQKLFEGLKNRFRPQAETTAVDERNATQASTEPTRLRDICLSHADDLIRSAERVLHDGYPNIAYHLAVLALEEIGKAGMIVSRAAIGDARDNNWMDKRFDDHIWKILWAVWSRGMSGQRIDPKDFEEARKFAKSTHSRRLAGLYVQADADPSAAISPRDAVTLRQATTYIKLAQSRLKLERNYSAVVEGEARGSLMWFLDTIQTERGSARMFSKSFVDKYAELKGDAQAWMTWARAEFEKVSVEEREHLQRELARVPSTPDGGAHKWTIKIRLYTPSHSIRPKVLTLWNERVGWSKLLAVSNKKNELILEMKLSDTFKIENIYDVGLSSSKLCIVALNAGSLGFFWYELPTQTSRYYESIVDVASPEMGVSAERPPSLLGDWKQGALNEKNIQHAVNFLYAFGKMSDSEAGPIFFPYLQGLTMLSKSDIHFSGLDLARNSFLQALASACGHFGDWDGKAESFVPSLHRAFEPIMPDIAHRNQIFEVLPGSYRSKEGPFADAVSAKRIADLYLVMVADRIIQKRIADDRTSPIEPPEVDHAASGEGDPPTGAMR
jgi:AbiV family abortive infection protein